MNRAVFLDRDGTINVEKHYLYKIEDFELLSGVIDGLRLLQDAGYILIIITNQSGIGRGYFTEEDFIALNDWMIRELKKRGIEIAKVYYCPHHPKAKIKKYRKVCSCRKPAMGLYERATKEFHIDLGNSWSIGDKIRDCAICEKTDCRGVLIAENEDEDVINAVKEGVYPRIRYAEDMMEAAKYIVDIIER